MASDRILCFHKRDYDMGAICDQIIDRVEHNDDATVKVWGLQTSPRGFQTQHEIFKCLRENLPEDYKIKYEGLGYTIIGTLPLTPRNESKNAE